MEIQNLNSIQTVCANRKKFWRAFNVSEDCFKTFVTLSLTSELIASSDDFLLIGDEDEQVWLFERKGGFFYLVYFDAPFLQSIFGDKVNGFLATIEMPKLCFNSNLLVCEGNIYLCKDCKMLDENIFQAKVFEKLKEEVFQARIGPNKELMWSIS